MIGFVLYRAGQVAGVARENPLGLLRAQPQAGQCGFHDAKDVSTVSKKKLSREELLMGLLNLQGHITTDDAVRLTGVSQATVRRMFLDLEKSGKIIRTYGGAQLPGSLDSYRFEQREKQSEDEKHRIGRLAASLVEDRDTIYLDCGTTLLQMAIALGERLRMQLPSW